MFSRISILVCMVAALALGACGRRGALEPPPGAPPEQKTTQQTAPKTQPAGAPGGLFRDTGLKPAEPEAETDKPAKRPSPFVLDPLL